MIKVLVDSSSKACFMDIKISIYNPFILGTQLNTVYSDQRKTNDMNYDTNCCLDLPFTNDF